MNLMISGWGRPWQRLVASVAVLIAFYGLLIAAGDPGPLAFALWLVPGGLWAWTGRVEFGVLTTLTGPLAWLSAVPQTSLWWAVPASWCLLSVLTLVALEVAAPTPLRLPRAVARRYLVRWVAVASACVVVYAAAAAADSSTEPPQQWITIAALGLLALCAAIALHALRADRSRPGD
ncbi:hypothetical protein ACMYYO_05460 [Dermacoccaceae bacterium W4C1]